MSDQPVGNDSHGLHAGDEGAVAGHHGHGAEAGALQVLVVPPHVGLARQQAALGVEDGHVGMLFILSQELYGVTRQVSEKFLGALH